MHALQNHDELTYELVHFATKHNDDLYTLAATSSPARDLAEHVRQTLRHKITGAAGPYNPVFTQNGIACTTASVITATLGITDPRDRPTTGGEDQAAPPAAGHVQRLAARRLRAVRLGPVGDLPLDRAQVHSLIAAATPAGSSAVRTT